MSFRDMLEDLKKHMVRWQWRDRRFTSGIIVFMLAVRVSMIRTVSNHQRWQMSRSLSVCTILCKVISHSIQETSLVEGMSAGCIHSICQQRFERALSLSTLDSKSANSWTQILTSLAETSTTFPRLVTVQLFLVSTTKLFRKDGLWAEEVTADVRRAMTGIVKWFPEMLPKALWMLVNVCHCPRKLLWKICVSSCEVS